MSNSKSTHSRPGLATRAKNAHQRPGMILINGRRKRRSPSQMASDAKAAQEAKAVVAAKNASVTVNIEEPGDMHLKQRCASIIPQSKTNVEQPRSDGVESRTRSRSAAPLQVCKRTTADQKLSYTDVESSGGTTAGPQLYDIVSIAQMLVAELSRLEPKTTRDSIRDTQLQSYSVTRCSYFH